MISSDPTRCVYQNAGFSLMLNIRRCQCAKFDFSWDLHGDLMWKTSSLSCFQSYLQSQKHEWQWSLGMTKPYGLTVVIDISGGIDVQNSESASLQPVAALLRPSPSPPASHQHPDNLFRDQHDYSNSCRHHTTSFSCFHMFPSRPLSF